MYLSCLQVNPFDRRTQRLLRDPYHTHAAVMRGFPNGGKGRVLFRVENPREHNRPVIQILVQSQISPDWTELAKDLGPNLEVHFKKLALAFTSGQRLRFRLRANPIVKRDGKRQGLVSDEHQIKWLVRKAEAGGFRVEPASVQTIDEGMWKAVKQGDQQSHLLQIHTVLFEGCLNILQPEIFLKTLADGIGPAKGFGCGLLSLARA